MTEPKSILDYAEWAHSVLPRGEVRPYGPARCGTDSGYQTHRRKAEPTCDACRAAHRDYTKWYRAIRRGQSW